MKLFKDNVDLYLAAACFNLNVHQDYDTATKLFEDVLRLNPNQPDALVGISWIDYKVRLLRC